MEEAMPPMRRTAHLGMSHINPPTADLGLARHLSCALSSMLALLLVAVLGVPAQAAPDPADVPAGEGEGAAADAVSTAGTGDEAGEPSAASEALLDPGQCPALFGDADDQDYNRRVREAKLTWLEVRGNVVEITHTTSWKRPFYLELAGVALAETTVDEAGAWSAVVDVQDAVAGCPSGRYAVGEDVSLGKQARVMGVTDGVMLVDFEDKLAYLMTAEAEVPTWQMVWRSGWYFIKRREVTSTKSTRRKTNRNRSRKKTNRRSRKR